MSDIYPQSTIVLFGNWSQFMTFKGLVVMYGSLSTSHIHGESIICVYKGKLPSPELYDIYNSRNSIVVVSSSGGVASEDMNYARSAEILYINGVGLGFDQLCEAVGREVTIGPPSMTSSSPTPLLSLLEVAQNRDFEQHCLQALQFAGPDAVEAMSYIGSLLRHIENKETAIHFLYYALEDSSCNNAFIEWLKLMKNEYSYPCHITECRTIPYKKYPNDKISDRDPSSVLRALGRFSHAIRSDNHDYACYLYGVLPKPLQGVLRPLLNLR
jgi:hypothetical protein